MSNTNSNMVTNDAAVRLAHAFATYKSFRVMDLNNGMDCDLAASACTYLKRIQRDVGIELVEEEKLDATIRRMKRTANVLDTQEAGQ
jgi:hypothetical protein